MIKKVNVYSTCELDEFRKFSEEVFNKFELSINFELIDTTDFNWIDNTQNSIFIVEDKHLKNPDVQRKILSLRNNEYINNVFICFLFETKDKFYNHLSLTQLGCNYLFLKESDIMLSLYQLVYIYTEDPSFLPIFASTKKLFCPLEYTFPVFIESLSTEQMYLNSDFYLDKEISVNYLENLRSNLDQLSCSENQNSSYTRFRYCYEIDSPNAWDETELSSEDTILTRIESLDLVTREDVLFVGSFNNVDFEKISDQCTNIFFSVINCLNENILNEDDMPYSCIIFNFMKEEELLDNFFDAVEFFNSFPESKRPYLIIYNTKSTTAAFRKSGSYERLLCSEHNMSEVSIIELLKKFAQRKSHDTYLPIDSLLSPILLNGEIYITELSESVVHFITEDEIPLGAIITIDIGIKISLMICAPFKYLEKVGDKTQYMSLIIAVDHKESIMLRRSVNEFIYKEVNNVSILKDFFKQKVSDEPINITENESNDVSEPKDPQMQTKEDDLSLNNNYRKNYFDKFRRKK